MGMKKITRAASLILFFLLSPNLKAATDYFSVLSQQSPFQPGDLIANLGSDNLLKHQWQAWAEFNYLHKPLQLTRGGVTVGGIVDRLFVQHIGAAWAPTDWWNFEMDFPLIYKVEYRDPTIPIAVNATSKFSIGDVFLRQRFTILRRNEYPVGLSLNPYVTIPTGRETYYVADQYPTGGLIVSLDRNFGKHVSVVLNTGAETGQRIHLYDLDTRHRILVGGGFSVRPIPSWTLKAEIASKTDMENPFQDKLRSPTEALFGTDIETGFHGIKLAAGGGLSVIRGYDTPLYRFMAGLSYASPRPYRAPREKKKWVEENTESRSSSDSSTGAVIRMDESLIRGQIETFKPIHFKSGSVALSADAKRLIDSLSDLLLKHPEIQELEIIGHADLTGTAPANENLSLRRAEVVMRHLELRGIPDDLELIPLGVSSDHPLGDNQTAEGRQQNRRVVFHYSH